MLKNNKFLFLIIGLLAICLVGAKFPAYKGYVNDYAGTLSASDINLMSSVSTELQQKTGIQLVTVVIPHLSGEVIDDYSIDLFKKWGIGQKDKNNGILFITSIQDKKVRIEVGYGLEGVINDAKAGRILDDYVLPYYRNGPFTKGIVTGHLALAKELAAANDVQLTGAVVSPYSRHSSQNSEGGIIQFIFVILFILFFGRKSLFFLPLMLMGGSRNSNDFGGFGGGGGFGGFGGGFSGGGGASRGW